MYKSLFHRNDIKNFMNCYQKIFFASNDVCFKNAKIIFSGFKNSTSMQNIIITLITCLDNKRYNDT